jgi:hypothetical protein
MQKDTANRLQRDKILALLIRARGAWVPLPELVKVAAQYNARLHELRRLSFDIENRTWYVDGQKHSAFRLVSGPRVPAPVTTQRQEQLFPDDAPLRHLDLG